MLHRSSSYSPCSTHSRVGCPTETKSYSRFNLFLNLGSVWWGTCIIHVPHQTKSWPNSASKSQATKKGTLFVLVLLCSMGWSSTHVFQPKNVGSTQELGFTLVEWTLIGTILSKFPYPPMQLPTFNEVNFFLSKLLHEGGIYTFARATMNYKTHKLNVDYHFLNINIFLKINLNAIYMKLHVHD